MTNLANLAELAADVEWPDHDATIRAHDSLLNGPALGQLATLAEWTCGVQGHYPPSEFTRARLIVFAADHAIAAAGVSRADPGASAQAIAAIESGAAGISVLSRLVGAGVRVVQLAASTGRIDVEDAMTAAQCADAMVLGGAVADEEIDAGADVLIVGNIGIASTTAAAAIISVLTSAEPIKVTGRGGSAIDDDGWMRKVTAIRDARLRGWPARSEPQRAAGSGRRPGSGRANRFPAAGRDAPHTRHPRRHRRGRRRGGRGGRTTPGGAVVARGAAHGRAGAVLGAGPAGSDPGARSRAGGGRWLGGLLAFGLLRAAIALVGVDGVTAVSTIDPSTRARHRRHRLDVDTSTRLSGRVTRRTVA